MASVRLKNISKVYDNKIKVVSDFNLEIADKEFVVFVGPSGCGKSTTLRMISGLEKITGGELFIGERLVNTLAPKDRDIAMVFQNYALYPHMTVYENMAFGLKVKKTPKDEIDRRVQEAAQILDITQYLDRRPKALSGGQRQRVAIGRAIVRHPQVFLMDEPLSNLDAKLRTLMRTEILKLHRRLQTTMIYVTHDQVEAMTLGDRIVVMKDGIIQQVDTPHNIFENPCNMFVAGFIGSPQMNFLSGKLSAHSGRYAVEIAGRTFDLPAAVSQRLAMAKVNNQDVTVGIRPEYLELCAAGEGLTLELDVAELIGSEIYMHANLGEQRVILKVSSDLDVKRMSAIHCRPKDGKIHLFSTKDGHSLTV